MNFFTRIKDKLLRISILNQVQGGFLLVLLIFLLAGLLVFYNTNQINQGIEKINKQILPVVRTNRSLSSSINAKQKNIYRSQIGLESLNTKGGNVEKDIRELKTYTENKKVVTKLNKLSDLNSKLQKNITKLSKLKRNDPQKINLLSSIQDISSEISLINASLSNNNWMRLTNNIEYVSDFAETMKIRMIFITITSLLLGGIMGFAVRSGINKVASQIKSTTQETAEQVESVTDSVHELEEIAQNVGNKVQTADKEIDNLITGNKEVTSATQEVATAIQEVAQGTEDIAQQAETISEVSNNTYQTIEKTSKKINQGTEIVNQTVTTIENLQDSVDKIDRIANRIIEITDQTNLLALNASIEAARANSDGHGRQSGQGFTVVAEEIKALADESMQATKEIQNIAAEIKKATNQTVEIMISGGEDRASITDIFTEVDQLSSKVLAKMDQVIKITNNQAASTEEVSSSTEEISASSEQVLAQAEETASSTEQLKELIEEVNQANNTLYSAVDELTNSSQQQLQLIKQVVAANKQLKKN